MAGMTPMIKESMRQIRRLWIGNEEACELVTEVALGSLLYNMAAAAAAAMFYRHVSVFFGLAVGMIITDLLFLHMVHSAGRITEETDPDRVKWKMMATAAVRQLAFGAVFLIILFRLPHVLHPLAVLAGAFGLKAGIYLRPLSRKLLMRGSQTPDAYGYKE